MALNYKDDPRGFTLSAGELYLRFLGGENRCTLYRGEYAASPIPFVEGIKGGAAVSPTSASYKDGCIVSRFDDGDVRIKVDMY